MNIKYTILGFLSWRPLTGYDLKKLFVNTIFIYWSGNNNLIYTTLLQLHHEELVTSEVQHQENGPTRKLYSITQKGLSELRMWVQSEPALPQMRKSFLLQLAWADQLEPVELDALLAKYEETIHLQVLMSREKKRRNEINPARTQRETYLWNMIYDNCIEFHESESAWIQKLRKELGKK